MEENLTLSLFRPIIPLYTYLIQIFISSACHVKYKFNGSWKIKFGNICDR